MSISAYILKIVEKDPFLRLQMRAKEDFNRHQLTYQEKKLPGTSDNYEMILKVRRL